MPTKFELNILGCGSATASLRHFPSCQVLNIRDNLFMIDCGEGAQLQLRKMSLKYARLSNIFISHLHGDHCFGLPGLISTMALLGKTGEITIHTFEDGQRILGEILDFFCRELPFKVRFNVISPSGGLIYEDDAITVDAFPLYHRVPTVGFRFAEKPKMRHIRADMAQFHGVPHYEMNNLRRGADFVKPDGTVVPNNELTTDADPSFSYAYCSDTVRSQRVVEAVAGVDWLYHEATYDASLAQKARARGHSTSADAALVAQRAGVKHLILGHFSKRYNSTKPLVDEARRIFPSTIAAEECLTIDLTSPPQI
ncbi:MAG TPA: ribonuclease Z [Candidatus Avimuribaculum pullicola]|nr:ribonuclease Z [Candidatus Avimuribaculum pullicola]